MITSLDNLGVVTNNSAAVVHLGVGLLALSGEGLLALLNVGGVHNGLAYGPRHLTLVLLWDLVTLSVLLLVTLRATGVSSIAGLSIRLGLSLSLAVSVTMGDNLGVVTNNSGGVADLLGDGVAVLGHNVFALLNVGGVHNGIVDLVANLPWHLALVLLGDLVALSVNLIVTLGAARVSTIAGLSIRLGLSLSLAVSVTMGDNLGVVTNNSGALVNLLGYRVAVFSDDVLALLDVGGVNNHVILLVTLLPLVLDGLLMTLLVWLAEALEVVVFAISGLSLRLSLGDSRHAGSHKSENNDGGFEHLHDDS